MISEEGYILFSQHVFLSTTTKTMSVWIESPLEEEYTLIRFTDHPFGKAAAKTGTHCNQTDVLRNCSRVHNNPIWKTGLILTNKAMNSMHAYSHCINE